MKRLLAAWKKLAPLKGLVSLAALHLFVSLTYILVFSSRFHADKLVIPLHLWLMLSLLLLVTLLMGAPLRLTAFRNWRLARFFVALLPALLFTLIVLLYAANFISNSFWGSNINYKLTIDYSLRLNEIVKELPVSAAWIYLPLLLLVTVIFALHLALANSLFKSLERVFAPSHASGFFKNRARAWKALLCLALYFAGSGQTTYILWQQKNMFVDISQEPFLGFFIRTPPLQKETPHTTYVRLRDRLHREQYPRQQAFDRKNVILMVADSLRADHMQLYGYHRPTTPFLMKLSQTGKLKKVRQTLSTAAETVCSVMSMMSSKNFKNLCQPNFTLYDLLHDQGYATYFILSGNHDWYGLREYYGEQMDLYFDSLNSRKHPLSSDEALFEGLEQVADFDGRPAFFYFHLMSPHYSGVRFDEFANYLPKGKKIDVTALLNNNYDASLVVNNYDDKVRQTDAVIERLFAALKAKGFLDNSLVVIIGDHGDGLGERNHFGHVYYAYQEYLQVPFLIYDQENSAYVNLDFATHIDVAPTIVERLGLTPPLCWDGVSLLQPNTRQYTYHLSSANSRCYVVVYRTENALYKYLKYAATRKEELYELVSDPKEERDLLETAPAALLEQMRLQCKRHFELADD